MKKAAAVAALGLAALWQAADACGPWYVLRPGLRATFWQPSVRTPGELLDGPSKPHAGERPYAGMASGGGPALRAAREAYESVSRWRNATPVYGNSAEPPVDNTLPRDRVEAVRRSVVATLAAHPQPAEAEELCLISAKVSLREAESLIRFGDRDVPGYAARRRAALEKARTELASCLARTRTPFLASEARGWLARCHYLLGEEGRAARIYLDELARRDSVFSRESLITSLHIVFPYNGSAAHLADHLDVYFDTPRHALFAVTLVTNPVVHDEGERRAMAAVGRKALSALERHSELFARGEDSERLAIASMRAALYLGDPERAVALAQSLPAGAKALRGAETRWMLGVAHFLLGHYAEAEPHLLAAANTADAPFEPKGRALLGLLAIYQKLDRPVDQLVAGLRYASWDGSQARGVQRDEWFVRWSPVHEGDWLLDVSYLLDAQLTDEQLESARERLGKEPRKVGNGSGRRVDARSVVDYALAVRAARRGDYAASSALYARLGAFRRAARMKEAGRVCEGGAPDLERRFACASFLAAHPSRVFFNDRLWDGFQRYALLRNAGQDAAANPPPDLLDADERKALLENERRFQDAQEERWCAFQVFDEVAQRAGHTVLGTRAARRALECLVHLADNDRFGRADDIRAARRRLTAWLRERTAPQT